MSLTAISTRAPAERGSACFSRKRTSEGKEIEIGEITFPPGVNSGEHLHGATEIFYMLSGELEHVVDGKSHLLKPGMLGLRSPSRER